VAHAIQGTGRMTRRVNARLSDPRLWAAGTTIVLALLAATPSEAITLTHPVKARLSAAPRPRPEVPRKRQADANEHHQPVPVTLSREFKRRVMTTPSHTGRAMTVRAPDATRTRSSVEPHTVTRAVGSFPSHWGATHLSI
jgi:hypothetical protein